MSHPPAPGCIGCRHLVLLHDPEWPYACRRFELRSRRPPHLEVQAATGQACTAREERLPPRGLRERP